MKEGKMRPGDPRAQECADEMDALLAPYGMELDERTVAAAREVGQFVKAFAAALVSPGLGEADRLQPRDFRASVGLLELALYTARVGCGQVGIDLPAPYRAAGVRSMVTGPALFAFASHEQWVDKAQAWYGNCGTPAHDTVAVDAGGRVCTRGLHFKDAAYPITVYAVREPAAQGVSLG